MERAEVGCWVVALSLLACGESSKHDEAKDDGGTGSGGESGVAMTSGAGGASTTGAAAGGGSELDTYFQPGSRLKPIVLTIDGGVDILENSPSPYYGWYDSELEFDCVFMPDEAGIERCFPSANLNGSTYSDATCTRRVLADGSDRCPHSGYVIGDPPGECGSGGFRVGAELPPGTPLFTLLGDACQPASASPDWGPYYDLEPVPAEAFVAMRRSQRARAQGLDAYVREGDDGSWEVIGHFDTAREASCFDVPFDLGGRYCVPSYASSAQSFADPTCERHAVNARYRSCFVEQPTVMLGVREDTNACPPSQRELYEIDEIRETAVYEVDDSAGCVESAQEPVEFYIQGAPIDLSALPLLETLVLGTGQVRARFSGFGGVPYLPLLRDGTALVDESGNACLPLEFPDGTLRCVPATVPVSPFVYEDAACSGSRVISWSQRSSCLTETPLPSRVLVLDPTAPCTADPHAKEVIAVVGRSTADTFYAKNSATGACEPASPLSPTAVPLLLGEVLSPSVFPEVERTIRQ